MSIIDICDHDLVLFINAKIMTYRTRECEEVYSHRQLHT